MRYGLHRVWVFEGAFEAGQRHVYARRTFFLDEDSWSVLPDFQPDAPRRLGAGL